LSWARKQIWFWKECGNS